MPTTGAPPEIARRPSLDAVLDFAWSTGVFTSGDALAAVDLTRSTTIEALGDLTALGLLRELPNARAAGEYSKGRPARRFELAAADHVVIGVDAARLRISTTVADLRGETLAHTSVDLGTMGDDSELRRATILRAVDDALAAAGRARSDALAICLGVPAPVDRAGHSPAHPTGFWEAMNPGLMETFSPIVPLVRVDNDANLAAAAERAVGSARDRDDIVALLAGERLGAGVVIDGHPLHGAHGGVGEMLAMLHVRGVDDVHGIGKQMRDWAVEAVTGHPHTPSMLDQTPIERLDARAVLDAARAGDVLAASLRDRAVALLARVVSVFGSLYGSSLVVVCGAVADGLDDLMAPAHALAAAELDVPPPDIVASRLGAEVVAIGAVRSALDLARTGALGLLCRG